MDKVNFLFQRLKDKINFLLKRNIRIYGNYKSFEEALKNSQGYSDELILKKKINSFLSVLKGHAAYEQDTLLFFKENYDNDLLDYLNDIQKKIQRNLIVLDFGGSFGTLYFKNYKKFNHTYDWNIIEQENIVNYINENNFNLKINFFKNLNDLKKTPDVVIFSGSIQYLPNPYEILEQLIKKNITNFLFLKTSFHYGKDNIFSIQKVPKNIYQATYPITIFSYVKFIDFFKSNNFKMNKFRKKIYIDGIDHLSFSLLRTKY